MSTLPLPLPPEAAPIWLKVGAAQFANTRSPFWDSGSLHLSLSGESVRIAARRGARPLFNWTPGGCFFQARKGRDQTASKRPAHLSTAVQMAFEGVGGVASPEASREAGSTHKLAWITQDVIQDLGALNNASEGLFVRDLMNAGHSAPHLRQLGLLVKQASVHHFALPSAPRPMCACRLHHCSGHNLHPTGHANLCPRIIAAEIGFDRRQRQGAREAWFDDQPLPPWEDLSMAAALALQQGALPLLLGSLRACEGGAWAFVRHDGLVFEAFDGVLDALRWLWRLEGQTGSASDLRGRKHRAWIMEPFNLSGSIMAHVLAQELREDGEPATPARILLFQGRSRATLCPLTRKPKPLQGRHQLTLDRYGKHEARP